ncbi:FCP1 homology domain, partial [Dillenia turbinata]
TTAMGAVELGGEQVYSPPIAVQVWRAVLNWLGFFVQIFLQILRSTPSSFTYLISLLDFSRYTHRGFLSPSSLSFKPLPVIELPLPPVKIDGCDDIETIIDANQDPNLEKLTVVLDLDETLVCAYETSSLPPIVRTQAVEAGLKCFQLECVSSEKECEGKPKVSYVTVFERPGLQEFLKQISKFADLVLFTAGLEGYASPLVDRIDVENRFSLRLYRPSTTSTFILKSLVLPNSQYREHVKDLSCLSRDLSRIVIVDNNPFSFLLQPLNGIPCVPFTAGLPNDEQLMEVILPLLKQLSQLKDVRPVLYERFRMPEWFQKHGIPVSVGQV